MIKRYYLALVILFVLFFVSCSADMEYAHINSTHRMIWNVVQSPITGKYYEVAKGGGLSTGFMGMAEITEEEYKKAIAK